MSEPDASEYSFLGLCNHGRPLGPPTLAYLVGLADSPRHIVGDPSTAKSILRFMFDFEELAESAAWLVDAQKGFVPEGYHPQTPALLTKSWSPVSAMLEQGFNPVVLNREEKQRAVATGIWEPASLGSFKPIKNPSTVEQLFWEVLREAFRRAAERKMLVSLIAMPGWSYDTKIGSLPKWSAKEVAKADRILWKRTPED